MAPVLATETPRREDTPALSLTDTRALWRDAVATVAERAKATLPQCTGRIDKAVTLVLNGDVEILGDGTARVASQSNGQTIYRVVNGHCDCKDYPQAFEGWCKHCLAHAITKRAYPLAKAQWEAASTEAAENLSQSTPAPTAPLPEAPASINVHLELAGRQVQLTLRDSDENRLLQWLEAVLQRFPLVVKPTDTLGPTGQGWCSKHGVPMRQNHKDGRSWWSHKTTDGWCKGK